MNTVSINTPIIPHFEKKSIDFLIKEHKVFGGFNNFYFSTIISDLTNCASVRLAADKIVTPAVSPNKETV